MNPIKGEVPLDLDDGRKFTLLFDHEGLIEAETTYGKPLHKVLADARDGFVGATRALLFGALRARHPDLTLGEASAMIFENGEAIGNALAKAYEAGMPAPAASAEGKAAPRRRAGKTSGGNGAKPA